MDLYEAMRGGPTTRSFAPDPVPREVLRRVLDNARFAPSGGNRQGWRVIAVEDPATRAAPPVMRAEWFTRDNVNRVLASAGVPNEIDVLSLDIDGNDLHLWNAMTVRPRILICEFNNAVPSELALTIPYQPDFSFAALPSDQALFRSASLAAYAAVSRRKGYRFVGMNALGFNAIFLPDDVRAGDDERLHVRRQLGQLRLHPLSHGHGIGARLPLDGEDDGPIAVEFDGRRKQMMARPGMAGVKR